MLQEINSWISTFRGIHFNFIDKNYQSKKKIKINKNNTNNIYPIFNILSTLLMHFIMVKLQIYNIKRKTKLDTDVNLVIY